VPFWQQYVFLIAGNSILGAINNWQNPGTATVCGSVEVGSTPIWNGIPEGYTLQITLQNDNLDNVSGAIFEVINGSRQVVSRAQLSVNQTGCNCHSGVPCTGSTVLSPITAFQVNVVGLDKGESTKFTSGKGTIGYSVSSGALTALANVPRFCSASFTCTGETSNASYGQLLACPEQSMTQTFGII
jgi:hypothetical protein